jgi:predicted alpha/beta-fold hydrolase
MKVLTTILTNKKNTENYHRIMMKYKDGGQAALDRYPKNYKKQNSEEKPKVAILFLQGILNTTEDNTILKMAKHLHKKTDFPVFVMNKRGFLGIEVTGSRPFNFSNLSDYEEVILKIKELGYDEVVAVGISLGANSLQHYVGRMNQLGKPHHLKAVVGISSPLNFEKCSAVLDSNYLLKNAMLFNFKLIIEENMKFDGFRKFLDERGMDYETLMAMKSVEDIDTQFNTKAEQCKDRFEFYERCSGLNYLDDIDIPCLFLNSKEDPLVT